MIFVVMQNRVLATWKQSWPMGQAFVMAMLVHLAMWFVVMLASPSNQFLLIQVDEIPGRYMERWVVEDQSGAELGPEFPYCYWVNRTHSSDLVPNRSDITGRESAGFYQIECLIDETVGATGARVPYQELLEEFQRSSGWSVTGHGASYRTSNTKELGGAIGIVFLLLPLGVTVFLLRSTSPASDIRKAFYTISRKPWLLVVLPLAVMLTSLVTMLWGGDPQASEHDPLFETYVASVVALIVIMPLLEEAIFRQWLYVRVINRVPVVVAAVGSSWFFMLVHIFNPQTSINPGYLLVVFVMGMILFWLRHRFGSFTLPALAHILNNAFFTLGMVAMM